MKVFTLVALLGAVAVVTAQRAETCDPTVCLPPDCRCSSTDIPGGLNPRDTPQFVTITFNDAVTAAAMPNFREVLYNRRNSNGCPAGATFFVSHEWTDYSAVNELYNNGFEIGLHSISKRYPSSYWANATYDDLKLEIADQKQQLSRFANIPMSALNGVRHPFLQLSGDNSFKIMKDYSITYDSSWSSIVYTDPGLWPYTLDYASTQDCQIPPCPTSSIPGVWVQPMISWIDLGNFPCATVDSCPMVPDRQDGDAWFQFLLKNFERHYLGNRAPLGFHLQEAFLQGSPEVKKAMIRFVDVINNLNDVFMVNANEVIEWIKDPVPIDQYKAKQCKSWLQTPCARNACALRAQHNNWNYYMTVCGACPKTYPWVGNPLGQ